MNQRRWGPPVHRQEGPPWARGWHAKRRFFFTRVIGFVVLMALLVGGGMAILAMLLTRFFGGDGQTVWLVWLGGCGLSLALPLLAAVLGLRALRSVAVPFTEIMAAIDAVAAGDLSVRVREGGRGEINRLTHSFNHMIEELERTDRQRRNLTADVAHELRTPLHIIQGNLEGILDGVYEPSVEQIEATLEETRLLARLVDDLRVLSLAESGELPLAHEPVDVADLLADVATSFSGQAEIAGIVLATEVTTTQPLVVQADPVRLDQVLGNLVANALRHTPAGGQVRLSATAQAGCVQIRVSDTGEGIAPEDLPFIFDRFWRGNRARTHSSGTGSGLGLSIASQLIKAHQGEIRVSSTPGSGTTFTVELPQDASLTVPHHPATVPES